jgi:hypothetical protein
MGGSVDASQGPDARDVDGPELTTRGGLLLRHLRAALELHWRGVEAMQAITATR